MVREDAAEAPRAREEVLSGRGVRRIQDEAGDNQEAEGDPADHPEPEELQGEQPRGEDERYKLLRYRWHAKNFLKAWWVDPDSEEFDKEFDARTLPEQGFSVGEGPLNPDPFKHRGKGWATLHAACICTVMVGVAKTATEIGRPDLSRCVRCFNG